MTEMCFDLDIRLATYLQTPNYSQSPDVGSGIWSGIWLLGKTDWSYTQIKNFIFCRQKRVCEMQGKITVLYRHPASTEYDNSGPVGKSATKAGLLFINKNSLFYQKFRMEYIAHSL